MAARTTHPSHGLGQRHVPLGAEGPYCWSGKQAAGTRVASSPDSDLEAFSHNPAHGSFAPLAFQPSAMDQLCESTLTFPIGGVNNPTLGEFCFTMIGRADIEGSKSNVAMNAWLPQASYPCGNFSDTSSFKFRRSKGSLGHAFTVRIRTGNQNQTSFYPSVPHEISVLVELILGHLRYLLTDVPPQPNSPPDNVFRPDRPAEAGLGSKKRGIAPLPIHGISKINVKSSGISLSPRGLPLILHLSSHFHKVGLESSSTGSSFPADSAKPVPLAVVSLDSRQGHRIPLVRTSSELAVRRPGKAPRRSRSQSVPRPARGDPLSPRKQLEQSADSRRVSGLGPPCPALRANPFPEYDRAWEALGPPDFQGPPGGAPDTARRAVLFQPLTLPPTESSRETRYLTGFPRLLGSTNPCASAFTWNLSPLRPSKFSFEYLLLPPRSAPTAAPPRLTPKVSAQFGTVTRLPVHPASPVLLTKNGPLGALDSVARLNEAAAPSLPI
ncbi:hypothetical protein L1887_46885 [Cichorium endivia]|nr:hypothetical protein L1887_46885 [Cichorium endivia]